MLKFRGVQKKSGISLGVVVLFVAMSSSACRTTGEGVATVDKERGEVSLYSTNDKRSALGGLDKKSVVQNSEEALKASLRKNRKDVSKILALAEIQVAQSKLEEAEKNCKRALRLDLKNQDARKILAEIAMRRGNYDLASIFLTSIGGVSSKDSSVLNMLALIELQRSNNSGAMALLKKAINVNGNDLAARMNMGVLMLKYRQLGSAAVQFERVLKVMPDHADAKLHLAIIMNTRGKYKVAEEMYDDVLSADDKNPLALYNIAVLKKQTDEYDDALDSLKVYLKTTRGKATDTDQVFALIDDIQKYKASKGETVSDDDIQAMAAQMNAPQIEEKVAKAGVEQTKDKPKERVANKSAASKTEKSVEVAPAKKKNTLDIPEDIGPDAQALDEVSELEDELAH
jgi:tetratricopeptide (TPR) repeat protein